MIPRRFLLALALGVSVAAGVEASGPVFWTTMTAGDLLRGRSDGVFVGSDGVVTPGPQLTSRLTSTPPQVWSLATGADGTIWAGTGGEGRLIRIRPGQPEETIATTPENGVYAIAVSGTRVYYASAPDGRVYVVDGAAAPRPFFDPEEKYIWALAVDRRGRLWVGAGSPAVIYRVEPTGTSQVLYKPPAGQVVSLALDTNGAMLAGTEAPGRLYRFDQNDRPYVLLDSGLAELHAIAAAPGGVVFAVAIARGDDSAPQGDTTTSVAAATPAPSTGGTPSVSASTPGARRSVIYRIDASGSWESFWETPDLIYDIAPDGDTGIFAASGPEGRLYRVGKDQQLRLLTGVDAKQITRLATGAAGTVSVIATANPGRVISVGTATESPATYLSPVRDTKSASTWGTIRWESTAGVVLYTRSGNTEKTDDSWSDWSGPYSRADGEPIKSPPARFLQWKSVLTRSAAAPAPQLTSVTVAYLPRNTRPVVSTITVHPPGVVFQRPFGDDSAVAGLDDAIADARRPAGADPSGVSSLGKRMYSKSLQTITWKADDADSDHMTYALFFRREGETAWRPLKAELTDSVFVWDTTTVTDGRYVVKVAASDGPSNAVDRALTGERESDPIEVDNTPPLLTVEIVRQSGTAHVQVRAHDAQSAIAKLEFSVGGGRWQAAYPVDGLADSPDERYDIPVATEADLQRMVIRATDALGNVGTAPAVIR